jgi:hypothetical protein
MMTLKENGSETLPREEAPSAFEYAIMFALSVVMCLCAITSLR